MARQAVVLSERYITDRFQPDKAIDLLDEACSDLNLHDKKINRRPKSAKASATTTSARSKMTEDTERSREHFDVWPCCAARSAASGDEIAELEEAKSSARPELTMENLARVIELWTKIPASKDPRGGEYKRPERAGPAAQAAHRTGRGCREAVTPPSAATRRHLSEAQSPSASSLSVSNRASARRELVKQLAADPLTRPRARSGLTCPSL